MNYQRAGNTVHLVFIALNIGLTSLAMTADPVHLDPLWKSNGFCVVDHGDDTGVSVLDTEVLCALLLVASAVGVHWMLQQYQQHESTTMNPLMEMRLKSGTLANAAHGVGNLFVYFSPGPPPAVELRLDDPLSMANILMLLGFWVGVIRATVLSLKSDYRIAFAAAAVILTAQGLLQVPPTLSFTFSQSVIFIAASVDQFLMARQRRRDDSPQTKQTKREDDLIYLMIALGFLPLMALFPLEVFQCSWTLAILGGHVVYDAYLSALPFLLYCGTKMASNGQTFKSIKTV